MSNDVTKVRKNCMGIISFTAKFNKMRKEQEFVTYQVKESEDEIKIQSDTRIGTMNLQTGKVMLCKPVSGGAYFHHLPMANIESQLSEDEIKLLTESIDKKAESKTSFLVEAIK